MNTQGRGVLIDVALRRRLNSQGEARMPGLGQVHADALKHTAEFLAHLRAVRDAALKRRNALQILPAITAFVGRFGVGVVEIFARPGSHTFTQRRQALRLLEDDDRPTEDGGASLRIQEASRYQGQRNHSATLSLSRLAKARP